MLIWETKPLATGGENHDVGTMAKQCLDEVNALKKLLHIVQNDQEIVLLKVSNDGIVHAGVIGNGELHRRSNLLGNELGIAQRHQIDKDDAIGEILGNGPNQLLRQ